MGDCCNAYSTTIATPIDAHAAPSLPMYWSGACSYSQEWSQYSVLGPLLQWWRAGNFVHRNCDRAGDSSCCSTTRWALPTICTCISEKKKKRSLVPRQLLAERSRKTLSGNENRDEATAMLGSYKVKPLVTPQKIFFFFFAFPTLCSYFLKFIRPQWCQLPTVLRVMVALRHASR